jgi:hypothetical protein
MQTRSQTRKQILEVIIDFDFASKSWLANKKKLNNGCYSYICEQVLKNGEKCKKTNCKTHNKLFF